MGVSKFKQNSNWNQRDGLLSLESNSSRTTSPLPALLPTPCRPPFSHQLSCLPDYSRTPTALSYFESPAISTSCPSPCLSSSSSPRYGSVRQPGHQGHALGRRKDPPTDSGAILPIPSAYKQQRLEGTHPWHGSARKIFRTQDAVISALVTTLSHYDTSSSGHSEAKSDLGLPEGKSKALALALNPFANEMNKHIVCHVMKQTRSVDVAVSFYRWSKGVLPSQEIGSHLYTGLMSVAVRAKSRPALKWIVEELHKHVPKLDIVTYNSLLNAYGKNNMIHDAEKLWAMAESYELAKTGPSYGAMMDMYQKNGFHEKVNSLYLEMKAVGVSRDAVIDAMLITSFSKTNQINSAESVFSAALVSRYGPNVGCYLAMMECYASHKRVRKALHLLAEMKKGPLKPSLKVYTTLIYWCQQDGLRREGEGLMEEMKRAGFPPCAMSFSTRIRFLGRVGQPREAEKVFREMLCSGAELDLSCFHAMIDSMFRARLYDDGVRVIELMEELGLKGTLRTYSSMLSGLADCEGPREHGQLRALMERSGHEAHGVVKLFMENGRGIDASRTLLWREITTSLKEINAENFAERETFLTALVRYLVNLGLDGTAKRAWEAGRQEWPMVVRREVHPAGTDLKIDLHRYSLASAVIVLYAELDQLRRETVKKPEEPFPYHVVHVVSGKSGGVGLRNESVLKGALRRLLGEVESPFKEDLETGGSFKCTGEDLKKWFVNESVEGFFQLVDCPVSIAE